MKKKISERCYLTNLIWENTPTYRGTVEQIRYKLRGHSLNSLRKIVANLIKEK